MGVYYILNTFCIIKLTIQREQKLAKECGKKYKITDVTAIAQCCQTCAACA